MTPNTKALEALPEWANFERIDHDNGRISYESHGREDKDDMRGGNTFIVIDGHRAKQVAETIRAALTPQWMDISTAPRNGDFILLYGEPYERHGEYIYIGQWDEKLDTFCFWFDCCCYGPSCKPTHWQPLPAAPPKEGGTDGN